MPPDDRAAALGRRTKDARRMDPRAMNAAMARNTKKNGSVHRLTVAQYRNTLRDLLGLDEDLTEVLPPDGISKDGFANNGNTLLLSPLQVEAYFDIAEKALDLCIVDEKSKPVIQNFRMDLGRAINPNPCPDKLVLGASSTLLNNHDFMVTELKPDKPFDYQPFFMQTEIRIHRGLRRERHDPRMAEVRQHLPCRLCLHARHARVSERGSVRARPEWPAAAAGDSQAPRSSAWRIRMGRWPISRSRCASYPITAISA